MRPPLSYVPLLPIALLVIIATLIINPVDKAFPDTFKASGQEAIVESNRINSSGQHITVKFPVDGYGDAKARLTIPTALNEVKPGDSIRFSAQLKKPSPRTAYENDNRSRQRAQGIVYSGFVPPDSIRILPSSRSLYRQIRSMQPLAGELLKRSSLPTPSCEFLTATLTGDTSTLTDDTRRLFTSAGVAHVLALSGLHVGILMVVITVALFPLYIFRLGKLRLILTVVILWIYAMFTGLSPSVTRAVVMASAISGGLILQRRYFGFNGLLLAACIIIIASPLQLYQPGFQMSFLSVASILAISPILNRIDRKRRLLFYFASAAGISIAATIGTGIISAYYFHTFPVYFLIANIPLIAILPVLMGSGVLLLILEAFGYDPVWLCNVIDLLYSAIHSFVTFIASLPGATIDNLYFPGWITVPYYLTVTALIASLYLRRRGIKAACAAMAVVTAVCLAVSQPVYADEDLFLTRDSYSTSCIYRHHDKAYLISTAKEQNARSLIETYHRTYSDYLGKHGIDSIRLAPDTFSSGTISRNGHMTTINGIRYFTVTDMNTVSKADSIRPNHAVICRGFRGDVMDVWKTLKPDSIILSNDLHPRRHDRYADSLSLHSIPFRSLKHK